MARPRPVLPGKMYLATRRCARREYLLKPCVASIQAILYCFIEAALHAGVHPMWILAMSNHLHYGLHDPEGRYPVFLQRFHRNVAKVLNHHWKRWGNLFEYEQTSMVELGDAEAVFDKMIYSLTNPVKDQLVQRAADWPGASSLVAQLADEEIVAHRPKGFFADDSTMPEVVRMRMHRPPPFEHLSQAEWAEKIRKAVAAREREAHEERRKTGKRVVGVGAILAQSAFDSPETHEPRREMSPRVATRDKWRRIELLQRNEAFLLAYRAALEDYRAGNENAVFPPGTWQLYEDCHVYREAA
jgi:REP-associated tyrosine transposase